MNLYRISQSERRGYDAYSSAVVAAESEDEARNTHPCGQGCIWARDGEGEHCWFTDTEAGLDYAIKLRDWSAPKYVKVELIGTAREGLPAGVVCASFHAG